METVRHVQEALRRLGLSLHPTSVFHICRHALNLDDAVGKAVAMAKLHEERTK